MSAGPATRPQTRSREASSTVREGGTNFAVATVAADGMVLCLFDAVGAPGADPGADDYWAIGRDGYVPLLLRLA
jgi:hypothetical protein